MIKNTFNLHKSWKSNFYIQYPLGIKHWRCVSSAVGLRLLSRLLCKEALTFLPLAALSLCLSLSSLLRTNDMQHPEWSIITYQSLQVAKQISPQESMKYIWFWLNKLGSFKQKDRKKETNRNKDRKKGRKCRGGTCNWLSDFISGTLDICPQSLLENCSSNINCYYKLY